MNITRNGRKPKQLENIELFIKKWRPSEGWLIQDINGNFVIPTRHSTLGNKFFISYKNSVKRGFTYLLLTMLLIIVVFTLKPIKQPIEHLTFFTMLLLFAILDMGLSIKNIKNCSQKSEFLFELHKSFMNVFFLFAPFFFLILLTQIYLTNKLEGFENLIYSYGNYYPEIELGSIWRFIVGPLWHGDINHWVVNAVLTILFAAMLPISNRQITFCLFFLGAIGSHIITFLIHHIFDTSFDALIGISGGAYALLAYSISHYYQKMFFNIVISLLGLTLFTELSIGLLSINASHSAHFSGFIIGLLAYIFKANLKSSFLKAK